MSAASEFASDSLAGLHIYRLLTLANVGQIRLCDGAGTEQAPWESQADRRLSAAVAISRRASVPGGRGTEQVPERLAAHLRTRRGGDGAAVGGTPLRGVDGQPQAIGAERVYQHAARNGAISASCWVTWQPAGPRGTAWTPFLHQIAKL